MGRRLAIIVLCLGAAACGRGEAPAPDDDPAIAADPVIARALHDPLMSDPDLASRNEANAALGGPDSHALPVLRGSSDAGQAAREAMRLELLSAGPIPELPPASAGSGGPVLGPMASPAMLLAAVGAPATCAADLREDFMLAASLLGAAGIPPGAMVVQAGGSDRKGCRIRIIRYQSTAPREDLLQYHLTRALRAGLAGQRFAAPEDIVIGKGVGKGREGEALAVHVRPAVHGLNGVDLVYRAP